jgi:hypothetical protein
MKPEVGAKVIEIAKGLIGCHYINGAYGARPGEQDGCPTKDIRDMRLVADPARLDPTKSGLADKNVAVFAAELKIKQHAVCGGNYTTFAGGKLADPPDTELTTYLTSLKGKPVGAWGNFKNELTPRRVFGPGQSGALALGQNCMGIRHFDCIGFISYCYWKATGVAVQLEIFQWRGVPNPMGGSVYDLTDKKGKRPPGGRLMDADILVQADHHIGYVDAKGTIVEARDTHIGVRSSATAFSLLAPGEWTHLIRLPDPPAGKESIPAWLIGWWKVTWRGQIYFYWFDFSGVVKWTQTEPTKMAPPGVASDKGTITIDGPGSVTVRWGKTGSVEHFRLFPGMFDHHLMSGTWNETEPIEGQKVKSLPVK